ncbi:MAG: endopeptidase La, partial [Kiritimatiellales bacterium]|nr:endopeptidase La [Kiritimatiellales bacterium]
MSAQEDNEDVEIEVVADADVPDLLPVMPLKNFVLYPQMVAPLVITTEESKKLVTELSLRTPHFITALQRREEIDESRISKKDLHRVGCVARLIKTLNFPDGSTHVLVEGLSRCELTDLITDEPYPTAHYRMIEDLKDESLETEALVRSAAEKFQQLVAMSPNMPDELVVAIFNMGTAEQLSDLIATNLPIPVEMRQKLLADNKPGRRLKKLMQFLNREYQILKLGSKIENKVHETFTRTQREIFLREQLKTIQNELGEDDPLANEMLELEKKLEEAKLPQAAREAADRELQRLKAVPSASPEHGVIRTYLDVLSELPWDRSTEDHLDILAAKKVL